MLLVKSLWLSAKIDGYLRTTTDSRECSRDSVVNGKANSVAEPSTNWSADRSNDLYSIIEYGMIRVFLEINLIRCD